MKIKIIVLLPVLFYAFSNVNSLHAQTAKRKYEQTAKRWYEQTLKKWYGQTEEWRELTFDKDEVFQKWTAGANFGTYGVGIYGSVSILPQWDVRLGINRLAVSYNKILYFSSDDVVTGMPVSGTFSNSRVSFFNVNLLVDYYLIKNKPYNITGGFYIGNNYVKTLGRMDDFDGREITIDGMTIIPNPDGSFDAKVVLGHAVKPYLGLGARGKLPKNEWVEFRIDAGVVFQGQYKVDSKNIIGADLTKLAKNVDINFNKGLLKYWPMVNASVSYRLK